MQSFGFILNAALVSAVSLGTLRAGESPSVGKVDFAKDIQPVLAKNCFECHGPEKAKSGLRLDLKADALKGGDTGPLLVAGNSAKSLLIQVVEGTHADIARMPKKKDPLSSEQIALLRKWVDAGADWPEAAPTADPRLKHWAFHAPVRPAPLEAKNKRWTRNAIDSFVLARLEKEKLPPAPEADKITLLRRLSLDLIGLPPSPQEVDAFLADKSPDAYGKQVERLLASPHYGERWARHWLDGARYADSDGFEKDKTRNVWFYRDWVVNAFNRDLPYDQFVIEQLAGDQLPNATQDQIVATGFLRNSMLNEEGGIDPEQFRMEAMFDRMDCIGKSVLGLTIQCAQCHNHKFDPILQEDYYRLFAFLNNDAEPQRVVYTSDEQMLVANLSRQIKDLEAGLRHTTPDWETRLAKWEEDVKKNQPSWTALKPYVDDITTGGQRYLLQPDGSLLAQGYAPTKHGVHLWATNDSQNVSAFQLELLTDANLPANGPGRSFRGTCALSEFTVEAVSVANASNKVAVKFSKVTADYEQSEAALEPSFEDKSGKKRVVGPVAFANDNNEDTAWGIDAGPGRRNQDRKAVFQCATNVGFAGGTVWHLHVIQRHGGWNSDEHMNNNLGRFRISVASSETPVVADPVPKRVRDIFVVPREKRSPAQIAAVFSYGRTTLPEFKEANENIEKLWGQWPEGTTSLTLAARTEPRATHMLKRGDFLKPDKAVTPGAPGFLHALPANADGSRLTLAKWLVDKKSPTTARAFVNRLWQAYFGTGLVTSPEDFGTRCELPSHPELLDWLACEFMDSDWSIKKIQRLIVTSATYRQSSHLTPELYARDPYNRLLARGSRLRVEGEVVRDVALAASGLLNPAVGGRSIFPPTPEFLFLPPASYGPKTWKEDTGAERYRRGLYVFRWRSVPNPMLQTFDAPNGDFSCVRRQRSNNPLQALVSLNETTFMECAQALARKTLAEGGKSDSERINFAFRRAVSRAPTDGERKELLALLEKEKQHLADGWVNPNELATSKNEIPRNLPPGATPTQLAAFTVVSRVLLNLDETITKE
ncbi:MAG: DUF1549 domain-containing protein [Pedosphaera sp.]|nr:DUF1549 domain-containing protein [Pedosphaera sp.]